MVYQLIQMDPWGVRSVDENSERNIVAENTFQDSFLDKYANQFEKLPDSEEYLKILEDKLKSLNKKKAQQGNSGQVKQDILASLLRSESRQIVGILDNVDLDLDRGVNTNLVVRQLLPKQPLTIGETVRLVDADQLDKTYSEVAQEQNQMSD